MTEAQRMAASFLKTGVTFTALAEGAYATILYARFFGLRHCDC